MGRLGSQDLLEIWDLGKDRHSVDRALLVLAKAHPEMTWQELTELSIGRRDALLLDLRRRQVGNLLWLQAHCPQCHTGLEFETSVSALRRNESPPETFELRVGDFQLLLRPLSSRDLAAAKRWDDPVRARQYLLNRVVVRCLRQGGEVSVTDLSTEIEGAVVSALSEADPQAELSFGFDCVECGHRWISYLDVPSLLWSELTGLAQGLMQEMYELAAAFGWDERQILALPAARRRFYLRKIRA